MLMQVLVLFVADGSVSLSTKLLEPSPGAMLSDRALVQSQAEEMARVYIEQLQGAHPGCDCVLCRQASTC